MVLNRPTPFDIQEALRNPTERVWYFAYGANMNPISLTHRRKVKPIKSVPAVVKGWTVKFHMRGMPFLEPAFACLEPADRSTCHADGGCGAKSNRYHQEAHGVAHLITKADFVQVIRTEGGGGHSEGYWPVEVLAETSEGESVTAFTLEMTDGPRMCGNLPSKRYLQLMVGGCEHHGVNADYIEHLKQHPHHESTWLAKVVGILLVIPFLPLGLLYVICSRLRLNTAWFHGVFVHIARFLWSVYSFLPKRWMVRGSGSPHKQKHT